MEIFAGGFVVAFVFWLFMAVAAAAFLARHDKVITGLIWGFVFGPLGVLFAFLKAENLDRQEREEAGRARLEQDITRAIVAALATQEPEATLESPTNPPRSRSYDEIMASSPKDSRRPR